MKTLLTAALFVSVAVPAAAECITTPAGRTICRDASGHVVASPPGAVAPAAPVAPAAGAVVVAPGAAVAAPGAVVAPRAVVGAPAYTSGVATAHTATGGAAAYNPRTGNAAVSHTNAYGVTNTETARGGQAVTKNGMGVAQGPAGHTCAKGRSQTKCN